MLYALALLQEGFGLGDDKFLVMGVVTLATLVALGLRFFVNMFEVIRYPAASLKHHGAHDNFFFSLVVVFLGGLIGAIVLLSQQEQMAQGYHEFAQATATAAATGVSNSNYRDLAGEWATNKLDSVYSIYIGNNLIFFPVLMLGIWFIVGSVAWLASKMFGGNAAFGAMLSTVAYPYFFIGIGYGCTIAGSLTSLNLMSQLSQGGSPPTDIISLVGAVLGLYGLILLLIAIAQAADLTAGQMIGVVVVLLIVLGGACFAGTYYSIKPAMETFTSQVKSFDPSKPGYTIPQ